MALDKKDDSRWSDDGWGVHCFQNDYIAPGIRQRGYDVEDDDPMSDQQPDDDDFDDPDEEEDDTSES